MEVYASLMNRSRWRRERATMDRVLNLQQVSAAEADDRVVNA